MIYDEITVCLKGRAPFVGPQKYELSLAIAAQDDPELAAALALYEAIRRRVLAAATGEGELLLFGDAGGDKVA